MLELDTNVALLAQVDVLTNQLVQALRYDFYGQGHANGNWVPKRLTK